METYLPIPVAVHDVDSRSGSLPADECSPKTKWSGEARFDLPMSTTPRVKKPDFQAFSREVDNSGKFRDVKKSGQVKMTPMRVINETVTYPLGVMTRTYFASKQCGDGHAYSKGPNGRCGCNGPLSSVIVLAKVSGRYHEQGDLDYWKAKYPDLPYLRRVGYLDESEIEAAKADAYAELFTGYGLGEELAEMKDSVNMLYSLTNRAFKILTQFRTTVEAFKLTANTRMAANAWMEFRYGIMPIAYSISDVVTLLKDTGRFRTVRKTVRPKFDDDAPPTSGCYWEELGTSDITCKVTAKAGWLSEELKMFDLIDINIITTGIQVMSWSMVVNWFINIYSFVSARVKSWTSLASTHSACVAIRTRMEYGTYLNYVDQYYHHCFSNGDSGYCPQPGYYGYTDFGTFSDVVRNRLLLSWRSVNNYHRYLYQPSDVKLVFDPFMDWRRGIDATILGWGVLSKALRRL